MKTIRVDGVDISFHMERTDDGGMVIVTLVPVAGVPDEFLTYREWTGKGITTLPDGTVVQPTPEETEVARDQARGLFASLNVGLARARVALANKGRPPV